MNRWFFIFILIIAAIGLGGGIVYDFWLTLGALAFLLYLAVAWRWTLYAFFLLVAYLPFQAALNLTLEIDLMSGRVLILGLFGVWWAKEIMRRMRHKREKNPSVFGRSHYKMEDKFLVLFFIISVVSIFGAENQIWGLRKLLVLISVLPLFWLTAVLIKNKEDARKLIYIIIGSAAISALIALAQFLAQFIFGLEAVMSFWALHIVPLFSGASFGGLVISSPSWLVNIDGRTIMRAVGLFPDPHMLAFYLGLASPFALSMLFFRNKFRLVLFFVSCLLLIVLLLTFSRGGYFGLLSSLVIFVLFGWHRGTLKDKEFFSAVFLLAAIILLFIGWSVAARLISSFDIQEGSNMGRFSIWQDSWRIIKQNPITGVGLGNYPLAVNFNQVYRSAVTSHNLYLDIWVETGIFGLLAWLASFLAAAKMAYAKLKQYPVMTLGIISGLAYFFMHSFFETAIFNPTVLGFLMISLGLSAASIKGDVL